MNKTELYQQEKQVTGKDKVIKASLANYLVSIVVTINNSQDYQHLNDRKIIILA